MSERRKSGFGKDGPRKAAGGEPPGKGELKRPPDPEAQARLKAFRAVAKTTSAVQPVEPSVDLKRKILRELRHWRDKR
ncbi:MAG: hypothetical protein HY716_03285 [Planctomycetes bacterium]|nr:hypothetical protein [Planctomycetota bacterium]